MSFHPVMSPNMTSTGRENIQERTLFPSNVDFLNLGTHTLTVNFQQALLKRKSSSQWQVFIMNVQGAPSWESFRPVMSTNLTSTMQKDSIDKAHFQTSNFQILPESKHTPNQNFQTARIATRTRHTNHVTQGMNTLLLDYDENRLGENGRAVTARTQLVGKTPCRMCER